VALLEALGEVLPLEDRLQGLLAEQAEHVRRRHPGKPFGVVTDLGPVGIEDLEGLLEVGLRVVLDLFGREHRSRLGATARVADLGGVVADDQDRRVALVLEQPEDVEDHQVAGVDVRRGRVQAELDAQLVARLEPAAQVGFFVDLDGALVQPWPERRCRAANAGAGPLGR